MLSRGVICRRRALSLFSRSLLSLSLSLSREDEGTASCLYCSSLFHCAQGIIVLISSSFLFFSPPFFSFFVLRRTIFFFFVFFLVLWKWIVSFFCLGFKLKTLQGIEHFFFVVIGTRRRWGSFVVSSLISFSLEIDLFLEVISEGTDQVLLCKSLGDEDDFLFLFFCPGSKLKTPEGIEYFFFVICTQRRRVSFNNVSFLMRFFPGEVFLDFWGERASHALQILRRWNGFSLSFLLSTPLIGHLHSTQTSFFQYCLFPNEILRWRDLSWGERFLSSDNLQWSLQ